MERSNDETDRERQRCLCNRADTFVENGDLDLASTDRMVDFYLERGATGLTVLGMMGEAQKLTIEELQS